MGEPRSPWGGLLLSWILALNCRVFILEGGWNERPPSTRRPRLFSFGGVGGGRGRRRFWGVPPDWILRCGLGGEAGWGEPNEGGNISNRPCPRDFLCAGQNSPSNERGGLPYIFSFRRGGAQEAWEGGPVREETPRLEGGGHALRSVSPRPPALVVFQTLRPNSIRG